MRAAAAALADRRVMVALHALVLLLGGIVALDLARAADGWARHVPIPWLVVAAMFLAVEWSALHIEIRRDTHSLSLSAIPLVFGLLAMGPVALTGARLAGSALVLVAVRRRLGLKLAWNLALYTLETGIAALIATAALSDGPPNEIVDWLVLLGAVLAAELIGLISVPLVIMIADGELRFSLFAQVGRSQMIAAVTAAFGVLAAAAVIQELWLLVLAAAPLLGVAWLLHRFGRLGKEHHDLQQLHGFTLGIAGRDPLDTGLRSMLTILRASCAAVAVEGEDGSLNVVARWDRARREETFVPSRPVPVVDAADGILTVSVDAPEPGEAAEIVARLGGTSGLAIPLDGPAGGHGWILIIDRLGTSTAFAPDEVALFGSLARSLMARMSADRLLAELEHQARTDALTGLVNRGALEAELDRRIADDEVRSGAVLLLDLNRFKEVNDSLGHQLGDSLLQQVADCLRDHLRGEDLAGRLGGDEFAVIVDLGDEEDLEGLVTRLSDRLAQPVRLEGITLEVGTSIGVACWPEDATGSTELLRLADIAMYEAKRTQEAWIRYHDGIDHSSPQRLALLGQVRNAVQNRELRIHLQPQLRPADGRLVGAEALLRWHHPERGIVPPGEFLPLVEQSSLAGTVTRHVVAEAIAATRELGLPAEGFRIWINLMARDLLDEGLAAAIAAVVAESGVAPDQLGFEVTESSLIINLDLAIANLGALRDLGCSTSVDDFGTGYASLQYLQRLPVDEVKIDRSFVRLVTTDPESAAIVRSTTQLVHDLGRRVVAEGVEDEPTLRFLADIGCDVAQGFHLGRPVDVESFGEWLRARGSDRQVTPGGAAIATVPAPADGAQA